MFSFSNHTTKRLFDKKIPSFWYDKVEKLVEIGENGHNTIYTPYCHVEGGGGGLQKIWQNIFFSNEVWGGAKTWWLPHCTETHCTEAPVYRNPLCRNVKKIPLYRKLDFENIILCRNPLHWKKILCTKKMYNTRKFLFMLNLIIPHLTLIWKPVTLTFLGEFFPGKKFFWTILGQFFAGKATGKIWPGGWGSVSSNWVTSILNDEALMVII